MSLQNTFKSKMAAGVATIALVTGTAQAGVQDGNVYYANDRADALAYSLRHCNEPMISTNVDKNSNGFSGLVLQSSFLEDDGKPIAPVVHYDDGLKGKAAVLFCGHEGGETPYTDDNTTNARSGYASDIEDQEYYTSNNVHNLRAASQRGDQRRINSVLGTLSDRFGASVVPAMIEFIKNKQQAIVATPEEPEATEVASVNHGIAGP